MITRDNFNEAFNSIKSEEIETEINKEGDFIAVTLSGYGHVFIKSTHWNEEADEECNSCGGMLADKDDFLRLLEEANHPYTRGSIEEQIEVTKEKVRRVTIQHIKNYVRLTHNEQDIKDLEGMTNEELSDILEEIKECSK